MQRQSSGDQDAVLAIDPDVVEQPDPAGHKTRRQRVQLSVLVLVATGGVVGSLARYGFSLLVTQTPGRFPWSTFWVNVSGSLLIGFMLVLLIDRFPGARFARPLLVTGFLGAYTTFSTYMVDADLLLRSHDFATAIAYTLTTASAGLAAAALGVTLARLANRPGRSVDEQPG